MRRGKYRYELMVNGDSPSGALLRRLQDFEDLAAVTAEQAISDLRPLRAGDRSDVREYGRLTAPASAYQRYMREGCEGLISNVQVPRLLEDTSRRLSAIPAGGNYRDLTEELTQRNLSGQKWGQENGSGVLSRRHFYAYRRLHPDIWSWTLNTKAVSVYHYRDIRALSVREFARLHSFPDRFVFTTDPRPGALLGRHDGGSAHSRYRQVGNAVPPFLARACAAAMMTEVFRAAAPRVRRAA